MDFTHSYTVYLLHSPTYPKSISLSSIYGNRLILNLTLMLTNKTRETDKYNLVIFYLSLAL